jgi:hypothetical protein
MKNFVLAAMVVLVLAVGAQAAVIQNSGSVSGDGDPLGTLTITDYVSAADTDLLLVAVGGMFKPDATLDSMVTAGPMFGTTTLTQLENSYARDGGGWGQHVAWYYLETPGDVTADISFSAEESRATRAGIAAYSIKGATLEDITVEVNILTSGAGSMATDIVASAGNTILIDFISTDDANGQNADASQTEVLTTFKDASVSSSYKTVAAGTQTMSWDFVKSGTSEGAHSVVAIVPEPATMSLLAIGGLGALLKRKRS